MAIFFITVLLLLMVADSDSIDAEDRCNNQNLLEFAGEQANGIKQNTTCQNGFDWTIDNKSMATVKLLNFEFDEISCSMEIPLESFDYNPVLMFDSRTDLHFNIHNNGGNGLNITIKESDRIFIGLLGQNAYLEFTPFDLTEVPYIEIDRLGNDLLKVTAMGLRTTIYDESYLAQSTGSRSQFDLRFTNGSVEAILPEQGFISTRASGAYYEMKPPEQAGNHFSCTDYMMELYPKYVDCDVLRWSPTVGQSGGVSKVESSGFH